MIATLTDGQVVAPIVLGAMIAGPLLLVVLERRVGVGGSLTWGERRDRRRDRRASRRLLIDQMGLPGREGRR